METSPQALIDYLFYKKEILDEKKKYMSSALSPIAQTAEYRSELKNLANRAFVKKMVIPKKRKLSSAEESSSEAGST